MHKNLQYKKKQKIVFAGTSDFSKNVLQALYQNGYNISAVITKEDRPSGRGNKLNYTPVKQFALDTNLKLLQTETLTQDSQNAKNTIKYLEKIQPDLMIVVSYGLIIPENILNLPRLGSVNIHASLLPKWRGASPIQHCILHGDSISGITFIQMDKTLDTGDILSLYELESKNLNSMTSGMLHDKLCLLACNKLDEFLEGLFNNKITSKQQDNSIASYARKITKNDSWIDWHNKDASTLEREVRAFNPSPLSRTLYTDEYISENIDKELRSSMLNVIIWEVSLGQNNKKASAKNGEIININNEEISVSAKKGILNIKKLQLPNGKAMSVKNLLLGKPNIFKVGGFFV